MLGFAQSILVGNVSRIDVRNTNGGKKVAKIGIAVNRKYRDKEDKLVEEVDFFDAILWGNLATTAEQYVNTGDPLLLVGRPQRRPYHDRENGEKKYSNEVVVDVMRMLGGKRAGEEVGASEPAAEEEDELPF